MTDIRTAMKAIMREHPHADNEQIATAIREMVPGAKTSAASVSSMKSRMKKEGETLDGDDDDSSLTVPAIEAKQVAVVRSLGRYAEHDPNESLEDAKERISARYRSLERMAERAVAGDIPSLIVSGPPGLGKSHQITQALKVVEADPNNETVTDVISGSITAVGLYIALWNARDGGVVVLDDCDDVFRDETALNILKAVLDSTPVRRVSWRKRASWLNELEIDDSFDFQGTVVFLTNVDFEAAIASNNRSAKHFEALLDRSMYLCLTLRARRDFMIRIRQVSEGENGMLVADKTLGLTVEQAEEVLEFVSDNQTRFYNLSLRLVRQVASCMKFNPETWQEDVRATKMVTI